MITSARRKLLLWHFLGIFVPGLQAAWANRVIRGGADPERADEGEFDQAFIAEWEARLREEPRIAEVPDKIYEHEISRREAISAKAQASLNSSALIVAVVSLVVSILESQVSLVSALPAWVFVLEVLYFASAFWLAFRAVHIHKYIAVEFDEFDELMEKHWRSGGGDAVLRGLRARRLAAVVQNRRQTLCTTNLVEASFLSLRNGLVVLVASALWVWAWTPDGAPVEAQQAPEPPARLSGEATLDEAFRRRYQDAWPKM